MESVKLVINRVVCQTVARLKVEGCNTFTLKQLIYLAGICYEFIAYYNTDICITCCIMHDSNLATFDTFKPHNLHKNHKFHKTFALLEECDKKPYYILYKIMYNNVVDDLVYNV